MSEVLNKWREKKAEERKLEKQLLKVGKWMVRGGGEENPGEEMAREVRRNSGNGDILEAKARENYKEGVANSIKYHRLS